MTFHRVDEVLNILAKNPLALSGFFGDELKGLDNEQRKKLAPVLKQASSDSTVHQAFDLIESLVAFDLFGHRAIRNIKENMGKKGYGTFDMIFDNVLKTIAMIAEKVGHTSSDAKQKIYGLREKASRRIPQIKEYFEQFKVLDEESREAKNLLDPMLSYYTTLEKYLFRALFIAVDCGAIS